MSIPGEFLVQGLGNAASGAVSGGALKSLMDLFGKNSNLMDILGSEGFSNMIQGVTAFHQGNKMGDMMDFQKGLATNAEDRTDTLFKQDQEDRERNKNLDFAPDVG